MSETVAVIGSGAREHSIVKMLARSPQVGEVLAYPGNAGILQEASLLPPHEDTPAAIADALAENDVRLTVVGPEGYLLKTPGLGDVLADRGITAFAPSRAAAMIEGSKADAELSYRRWTAQGTALIPRPDTMIAYSYPHFKGFVNAIDLQEFVLKVDGEALGKGVTAVDSRDEALEVGHRWMVEGAFGEAGKRVLIQRKGFGSEVSVMAFADGTLRPNGKPNYLLLPFAQDSKLFNGKNSGGMGAYSPVEWADQGFEQEVRERIVEPLLIGMVADGRPFRGCLFPGLMRTVSGLMLLECNGRMGDPETQAAFLGRLETDAYELFLSCAEGRLIPEAHAFNKRHAVAVVIASRGYPDSSQKGVPIEIGSFDDPDVTDIHAGTAMKDGQLVTNGGRVLNIVGFSDVSQEDAQAKAYSRVDKVKFDGMQFDPGIAS